MKALTIILAVLATTAATLSHAACPDPLPARTLCVEWVAPTQYTDGSPILPGELTRFRVYYSTTAGDFDPARSINVDNGDATELTTPTTPLDIPSPGPQGGDVDLFLVMTATDATGDESAFSNQVAKVVTFPDTRGDPNPPVIQNVIINITTGGGST